MAALWVRRLVASLSVLAVLPAFADCRASGPSFGGNGLASTVSKTDIARISALIGDEPNHVICGRMVTPRRELRSPLNVQRGFFAMTETEVVFLRDTRKLDLLFRIDYSEIEDLDSSVIGLDRGFNTLQLYITTAAGVSEFHLTMDGGASDAVHELRRRARIL